MIWCMRIFPWYDTPTTSHSMVYENRIFLWHDTTHPLLVIPWCMTIFLFLSLPHSIFIYLFFSLPFSIASQLYIHRSGRTARANATGTTVSLVAPEDAYHHNEICQSLTTAGVKEMVRYQSEISFDRLHDWLTDWLTDWLHDRPNASSDDYPIDWQIVGNNYNRVYKKVTLSSDLM